jgi:hypothetical protein
MIERRPPLDVRYFAPFGENGVVERVPSFCPLGHRLHADTVLIAAHPCLCAGAVHRTWRCWACDSVWVRPACARHPEWFAWL